MCVCATLVAQTVKNLTAKQTRVLPLGQENPLEKGMATDSSILAWRIPRTEEPGGLQSMGSQNRWTLLSDKHSNFYHITPNAVDTQIYIPHPAPTHSGLIGGLTDLPSSFGIL